jgi:hypothetical protein
VEFKSQLQCLSAVDCEGVNGDKNVIIKMWSSVTSMRTPERTIKNIKIHDVPKIIKKISLQCVRCPFWLGVCHNDIQEEA